MSAVATYAVMKFADGSTKNTAQPVSQTTAAPVMSQSDKLLGVIAHIKTLLPSAKTFTSSDSFSNPPHRKMGSPYNFYAVGTQNDAWIVRSGTIAGPAAAAKAAKDVYDYFVNDQKAAPDILIGGAAMATLTNTASMNMYRMSTADYTCSLLEEGTYLDANPTSLTGADISVSCSTEEEYAKNAKTQQPFYAAILSDAAHSVDTTMLGLPGAIKNSATASYKTTQVGVGGSDSTLTGGAAGLFYQTPDGTWHFFVGTQSSLSCSQYNTADLKKAYVGEACYNNDVLSAVTIQ